MNNDQLLENMEQLINLLQQGQARIEKNMQGVKTDVSTIKQNTQRLDQG